MEVFKPKPILNRKELNQIKQSKLKLEGKRILTDDVNKLKSLRVSPDISEEEIIHYYKEPIWIEYYIPKESRFALEIKYLFIKLVDEEPREQDIVIKEAKEKDEFIDIIQIMKDYPDKESLIEKSYRASYSFLESISDQIGMYKQSDNAEYLRMPIYLTETLMLLEPTLASLEFLGQFTLHNLNWLIRKLNQNKINFSLEDRTVSILIKRRNDYWETNNIPHDEDFELMSMLFFEQAFPHRGAEQLTEQDFLLD